MRNGASDASIERLNQSIKDGKIVRCSTTEYEDYLKSKFPGRLSTEQFESWLAPLIEEARSSRSQNGNIITIPVVVHVIHSGQALGTYPNISDAQVESQIAVLNNDYRRAMNTPGYNTNAVGADIEIQFALAKVDPNGNPTNGIDRVNMCRAGWMREGVENVIKPQTIWNPNRYLNMWTVVWEGEDQDLLGYAQFPSNSNLGGLNTNGGLATTDGVVSTASAFGSRDYQTSATGNFLLVQTYDRGRTMTHEVGHWLGLRHIWGDTSSCLVNASDSANDYCLDTPAAAAPNYVCQTIDSCPSSPGNDMIENYMDYTNDTCMNIFTQDQKARIRAVMNNSIRRVELKTSDADQPIPLFANDAEIKIEGACSFVQTCPTNNVVSSPKLTIYNRGTSPLTSATITYTVSGGAAQTYNWTGNLAQNKFATFTVPVAANTPTGNITASIVTANGTTDERSTNNSATGAFINVAQENSHNTTTVNFRLQLDNNGSETSWQLRNSSNAILYSGSGYANYAPNLIEQTWNLPANDCYFFRINDSAGTGLASLASAGYRLTTSTGAVIAEGKTFGTVEQRAFSITSNLGTHEVSVSDSGIQVYPNPAADVLNVTKVSNKAQFEIYNAAGQLVKSGNINDNKVNVSGLIKGAYIITVKEGDKAEKLKFLKK